MKYKKNFTHIYLKLLVKFDSVKVSLLIYCVCETKHKAAVGHCKAKAFGDLDVTYLASARRNGEKRTATSGDKSAFSMFSASAKRLLKRNTE